MISKKAINELYDFIVGTNNEHNLVNQVSDKKTQEELTDWFDIEVIR